MSSWHSDAAGNAKARSGCMGTGAETEADAETEAATDTETERRSAEAFGAGVSVGEREQATKKIHAHFIFIRRVCFPRL